MTAQDNETQEGGLRCQFTVYVGQLGENGPPRSGALFCDRKFSAFLLLRTTYNVYALCEHSAGFMSRCTKDGARIVYQHSLD
jgi:hypothetical protein